MGLNASLACYCEAEMATTKMPLLSKPGSARRGGSRRKESYSTPVALALPKIVEQGGGTDEDNRTTIPSSEKGSKTECSSNIVDTCRNSGLKGKSIVPIVQKITLDCCQHDDLKDSNGSQKLTSKNCKAKYTARPRTRLGQDRFKTQGRRPSTSTCSQPECKLFLNISNIPTRHRNPPRQIPSAKSYQNEGLPSLDALSQPVGPAKSSANEMADLCIGIQETWKVNSSETQKTRPKQSFGIDTKAKQKLLPRATMHFTPLHSSLGVVGFGVRNNSSRASSRMGRNSLDQFLRNLNAESDVACVKPKLLSDKIVNRTETAQVSLSPVSSHKNQFLQLKGFVRDPVGYHRIRGLAGFTGQSTRSANKSDNTLATSEPAGKRKSHTTPINLQKTRHGDVPMPFSSNPLDEAYHVLTYITL